METKQEIDDALAAERRAERERLTAEALDTHAEVVRAAADLERAKKAHAQACARLLPFRSELLLQVAA